MGNIYTKGERWKRYQDSDYYFSDRGRCIHKLKHTQKEVIPHYHKYNKVYCVRLSLYDEKGQNYRKTVRVHRVIYELFIGPIPKGMGVYHLNGAKSINDVHNLALANAKQIGIESSRFNVHRKLVRDKKTRKIYKGTREAAKALGVSKTTISDICSGKRKSLRFDLEYFDRGKD